MANRLNGNGNGGAAVAEAPAKRGPGRPRTRVSDEASAAASTAAPAAKRGFGKKPGTTVIDVNKLMVKPQSLKLTVKGLSPLIVHNFGAKAIQQILDKQTGNAKPMRAKKDPFAEFTNSLYVLNDKKVPKGRLEVGESWKYIPDTFGFPASGFKKAMVTACGFIDGIPKTWVRGLIHVHGDLLPIRYKRLVMRQDTVRVGPYGRKVADIRFRGEFQEWEVDLQISFNANVIKPETIAMLTNNAGFAVGVGEWRPEKDGSFGTFAIE